MADRPGYSVAKPSKEVQPKVDNTGYAEECKKLIWEDFKKKNPKAAAAVERVKKTVAEMKSPQISDPALSTEDVKLLEKTFEASKPGLERAMLKSLENKYPALAQLTLEEAICVKPAVIMRGKPVKTPQKVPGGAASAAEL